MNIPATDNWHTANQRFLATALSNVHALLVQYTQKVESKRNVEIHTNEPDTSPASGQESSETTHVDTLATPSNSLASDEDTKPVAALQALCAAFNLSPFERDILLLCAGIELDATFATLCATAHGDPLRPYPTFGLALAALPEAHWSALLPNAPLRRWRLIELTGTANNSLTRNALHIDERILHYLVGLQHLDERLAGLIEPVRTDAELVPSHLKIARSIVAAWSRAQGTARPPLIQLCAGDIVAKRTIAAAACDSVSLNLCIISAHDIPSSPSEFDALLRLWERETFLSNCALLLDCDDTDATDSAREHVIVKLCEAVKGILLLSTRERRQRLQRPMLSFDVHKPTQDEQRATWKQALGSTATTLNGKVEMLVSQFDMNSATISSTSADVLSKLADVDTHDTNEADELAQLVWDACRIQVRAHLDDLAQRIEPVATWDDLVLPELQRHILHDIAMHVKQRVKVYETWGFAAKGGRGLGISALFAGISGTGKTMAAEVLATDLRLDLYRIDLSQVVSKYIGETEKNLRRVFDAAEEGGSILLFDEADALFGKRSEVKDSHDRYANIEVSYLLQRMEAYRGLAILTTNMKSALDTAFLRRIRFIVQFPFPDATQRGEIWQRIFPPNTPTEGLDISRLARLNIPGGNIRNIALNAAFLPADAGQPVHMAHLLRAARSEYAKLEKSLTEAEIGGWV